MKSVRQLLVFAGLVVLWAASAQAIQFDVLDPNYNQQIYAGPLVPNQEAGMAWTAAGALLTRNGSTIREYSMTATPNAHQSTSVHLLSTTHSITNLDPSGYGMTTGTDGLIYVTTGIGLQRFNPGNWAAPAQTLAGTIGTQGYGITTLSDGRIAYTDSNYPSKIYVYDPTAGTNSLIYTMPSGGQVDGLVGGPGGLLAVTDRGSSFGISILTSSGSLVNSFATTHAPDGLTFGDGILTGSIFSNNNDGTISRYTLAPGYAGTPTITDIAQQTTAAGKAYGDLSTVGPDCAFYVFQGPNNLNGSTPNVGTHWDSGVTNSEASIVRIAALLQNADGTVSETCGFYSPTETVPEPGTLALLGAGAVGLAVCVRRSRKRVS